MIQTQAVVEQFRTFLADDWGYIWGTVGIMWTAARQKQKVNYMVSTYGTGWKNNSEAKQDNYYSAALYGEKWIGHYVVDCAGAIRKAFLNLGCDKVHSGCNLIWDNDLSAKGQLKGGKRTDGMELLPGTAVFVYKEKTRDFSHVGMYVGDGKVIEAQGTKVGVVETSITLSKWSHWGEIKYAEYNEQPSPAPTPEPTPTPTPTPGTDKPTLRRGSKGEYVEELQKSLQKLGYDLGPCGVDGDFGRATEAAVKAFQTDQGLKVDGICGPATWAALDASQPGPEPTGLYTVIIPGLTEEQANRLLAEYPLAEISAG